jgi:hypothetical protein
VAADWRSGRTANQSFNVSATEMDLAAGAPATETGTEQGSRRRRGAGAGQRGRTGRGRTRAAAGVGQVWDAGGEVVGCFLRTRLDAVEAQISTGRDIQTAQDTNPRKKGPWAIDPGKRPGTRRGLGLPNEP